jgi:hypothetical protein
VWPRGLLSIIFNLGLAFPLNFPKPDLIQRTLK